MKKFFIELVIPVLGAVVIAMSMRMYAAHGSGPGVALLATLGSVILWESGRALGRLEIREKVRKRRQQRYRPLTADLSRRIK